MFILQVWRIKIIMKTKLINVDKLTKELKTAVDDAGYGDVTFYSTPCVGTSAAGINIFEDGEQLNLHLIDITDSVTFVSWLDTQNIITGKTFKSVSTITKHLIDNFKKGLFLVKDTIAP